MESLRLIRDGPMDPYHNMAADEAIATAVGRGESLPTLRLYGWSPSAVSIGYFQELEGEVDLDFCASHGISVVRRITGGGAVFHGSGELTYSFSAPLGDAKIPMDVQDSYSLICTPIVSALRRLGLDAKFRPINDIEVGGRKVSGNAQTRRSGALLQHGTILVSLDRSLLPCLRVKKEKLEGKGIETVSQRVATLEDLLDRKIKISRLARLLVEEFRIAFGCPILEGTLTRREEWTVPELRGKYSSECWLRRR
jgi:lipoate-protein ligase A